jgi:uroporphyrin-III C-methyltransferase
VTDTPNPENSNEGKKNSARSGNTTAGLALILALIALTATGFIWYKLLYEKQELMKTDFVGNPNKINQSLSDLAQNKENNDKKITQLGETQLTLKTALEQMQNDFGRGRTDWIVAETEQLMLIANQRLQLAHDVDAALAALKAADRQLETLSDPRFLPARKKLAAEITQLSALEKTDIPGIALRLGSLAETIDGLPLQQQYAHKNIVASTDSADAMSAADDQKESDIWGEARRMWHDMLSVVRIRTDGPLPKPLLPPEQQYFLRENLRLLLLTAQRAVLQADASLYAQNLKNADLWVSEYFDIGAQSIIAMRQELQQLQNARIMAPLPDITGSLEILRQMARKEPR